MAEPVSPPWISTVRTSSEIENVHGLDNIISNTKYTVLSWLPKSLFEQFRRYANIYFLIISVLMLIGTYAPQLFQTPLDAYSTVITLVVVLMITSIKEGLEDLQRANSDKYENHFKATVVTFENGQLTETVIERQHIKSGDIVKLSGQSSVPVDMLLILTSMYQDGNQCYIETSNIDGETNLKVREAPTGIFKKVTDGVPSLNLFQGYVEYEAPNKNIHNFVGALHLQSMGEEAVPLSSENIMLRGSLFSNTDWAYGIAIYTGQETKLQMNNRHAPSKISKIEEYVNTAIKMVFYAQIVLVTISIISLFALGFDKKSDLPYVYPGDSGSSSLLPVWFEQWIVFFLLFNNFIPISLYVTIELVNLGQAFLISNDEEIYDEPLDCACVVRSSNLCQELGLVSNVFSDKTGTLTRNEMKFVQFVVNGVLYKMDSASVSEFGKGDSPRQKEALYDIFRCLTTCHTVVREKNGTYRAESPDELALVEGVGLYDCRLLERGTAVMSVEILGEAKTFEVLAVNAFNSDRKRMSILTRDKSSDEYFLMVKGADSVMMELCDLTEQSRTSTERSLLDMAECGLRTLCVAHKRLDRNVALEWLDDYRSAANSMVDRAVLLDKVAARLESNLTLLGVTAIEDRLQDEVPEVIADLAKTGIVLWMLTGDKEETAISIARSCNLLTNTTILKFVSKKESAVEFVSALRGVYEDVKRCYDPASKLYIENGVTAEVVFVMDGPSFKFFNEEDPEHRQWLLEIGQACRSVVACRLTPNQKQMVVSVVKNDTVPRAITLAIGDGANDVSMIREGDVGVGIFGKEGRQAANNADFAIGQFKFLRRLLLVHGRWNYIRQSHVFLYCMHKNMVLTLTLFWYNYYAAISGTSLYESYVYTGFNFFLGLPIITYGILDQDISSSFALRYPQVYSTGRSNAYLNVQKISEWIWNACCYAVMICLMCYIVLSPNFVNYDLLSMGSGVFVATVLSLQTKLLFMSHQFAWPQVFVMLISVGGMFLYMLAVSSLSDTVTKGYYWVAHWVFAQDIFWFFCFFSIPFFCGMIDYVGNSVRMYFVPPMEMMYREAELNIDGSLEEFVEVVKTSVEGLVRVMLGTVPNVNRVVIPVVKDKSPEIELGPVESKTAPKQAW